MNTNLDIATALDLLLSETKKNNKIQVSLLDGLGFILGESITSCTNIPPFDRSPLDGFAVRSEDISNASKVNPITLRVIDFAPAGMPSKLPLGSNEAIRIMTGAKIPDGADVVIAFEETEFTDESVTVFKAYPTKSNISFEGEDIGIGDKVISEGTCIDAPEIGILASVGRSYIKVYRKPRVAILSTGSELVEPGGKLLEGQIINSNSYSIAALVKKLGAEPVILPSCSDDYHEIVNCLKSLDWVDLVITTGGVSVGDKDYVTKAFQDVCDKFLFWKVKMKPGTPITAGKHKNKLLIGLSGNPAAAVITFLVFVKPVILKMMGKSKLEPLEIESTLLSDFSKVRKQNRFVRATTYYQDGKFYTKLPSKHSSGIASSLSGVNSLLYIPSGEGPYNKGQKVMVQLLNCEDIQS